MDKILSLLEMMEKIASLLENMKLLWSQFGHQIGYVTCPDQKMEELNNSAQDLLAGRDDDEVKITRVPPDVATDESTGWLDDVKQTELKLKSIQEDHARRPNVYSRIKLGKRVGDAIEEISILKNKRPKLKEEKFSPSERVELQAVEINSSTDSEPILQMILGLLEDVKFHKIGIWGMGGIGKTRTLKLLNNRLKKSHMFDIVIWVTASGKGSQRKVQKAIAKRLKCTEKDMFDDRQRANITRRLSGCKFLLILDGIWEKIDLSSVGIPTPDQHNGCKVLLTTRNYGVCQQMRTDQDLQIKKLSEDEAWRLFNANLGNVVMSPSIKLIARDIVKKCGGLPLAILVIGSSLRNNTNDAVWRNTQRELSQIKGMEEQVYSCLRMSYDKLTREERALFLYCSLYPKDYEILIVELAEYFWLEGYNQEVDSIEKARDAGRHRVMDLVYASMLERDDNNVHVKMHDIIYNFALKEASRLFLVKTGRRVKQPPKEKEWLQSQKISLMQCGFNSLSERPNCPSLSTLLLQDNDQLTTISDSFFECMRSLCILDLSGTNIKSLPSSMCNLVNLHGLYLKHCDELEELPSQIGKLKKLKVLHLGGSTAIKYLPREVGELTCLRRLIVGFHCRKCSQNDGEDAKEWDMKLRVPTGIIPKLPYLEELSLYVYASERVCVEKEQWDDASMVVVVDELCKLERLTYLDAYFPKEECLDHFLRHSKWVKEGRFRFRVGIEIREESFFSPEGREWERSLVYKGGLVMSHALITETLALCSLFHLQDHRTVRKLSELGLANMNYLKECRIIGCDKMETLFDGDEQQETCARLPDLEILRLKHLPEWRSLCDGPLLPESLSKLTHLELNGCKNLKKVFQLGIIRQLCSLEFLDVIDCSKMEEIIEIEEEEEEMEEIMEIEEEEMSVASHSHNVIKKIKKIHLSHLPELVNICRAFSNLEWQSLETIEIDDCPELKSLSFLSNTNIVAPALRKIKGESSWWEALEWEDNDLKQQLQPFFN